MNSIVQCLAHKPKVQYPNGKTKNNHQQQNDTFDLNRELWAKLIRENQLPSEEIAYAASYELLKSFGNIDEAYNAIVQGTQQFLDQLQQESQTQLSSSQGCSLLQSKQKQAEIKRKMPVLSSLLDNNNA